MFHICSRNPDIAQDNRGNYIASFLAMTDCNGKPEIASNKKSRLKDGTHFYFFTTNRNPSP